MSGAQFAWNPIPWDLGRLCLWQCFLQCLLKQLWLWWRLKTLEWKFLQIVFAQNVCFAKRWEKRWQQIREILKYLDQCLLGNILDFDCFKIFWQCWFMTDPCCQSWLRSRSCHLWGIVDKRPFSTPEGKIKHCYDLWWDSFEYWIGTWLLYKHLFQ